MSKKAKKAPKSQRGKTKPAPKSPKKSQARQKSSAKPKAAAKPKAKRAAAPKAVSGRKRPPAEKPVSKREPATPKLAVEPRREPSREAPPVEVPSRAPRRKIFGVGGSSIVVARPSEPLQALEEAPAVQEPEQPVVVALAEQPAAEPLPKQPWSALPNGFPAQMKFLLNNAEKECEKAGAWPFPFAKFIASLPREICGLSFALLLSGDRERASSDVSELCKLDRDRIDASVSGAEAALQEGFYAVCGEIYRKWTAQLGSAGKRIESMIEPYLLAKIDRDFQIMIGELVLKSLAA